MHNRTLKRLGFTLALCLLATAAFADPVTYKLDPRHTQVLASWSHFGFSHPSANFGQVDGTLVYDADDVAASSVKVSLPLAGLDTFVPALDDHLRGPDFFDVDKYPVATFESTAVKALGDGKFEVTGDLTIKGVTRPVVLAATLNKIANPPEARRPSIGFDATTTIKRSDFGIDKLVPNVSDEITLRITTEAAAPQDDAAK